MHPNPIYRRTTDARAFDLVRDRAFGQITLTGPDGLLASHIPVLLAPDETTLDMHLYAPTRFCASSTYLKMRCWPSWALMGMCRLIGMVPTIKSPHGIMQPSRFAARWRHWITRQCTTC